jgi:hypothetical protein
VLLLLHLFYVPTFIGAIFPGPPVDDGKEEDEGKIAAQWAGLLAALVVAWFGWYLERRSGECGEKVGDIERAERCRSCSIISWSSGSRGSLGEEHRPLLEERREAEGREMGERARIAALVMRSGS